ncbi:hypothetical protein V5O48_013495 [Marasmius crinis-equi]|uniref:Uncharacterized protein n=1 Tax=Marasmius crinis-equi TaxID=585013 RepID=A0ABR3F0B2_9AGAR
MELLHSHAWQQPIFDTEIYIPPELNATIAKLKGWYGRALANPYPTPDTAFNWTVTRDQFDIFVESTSTRDPSKFTVAFLRDNDDRRVVVDSMGRALLPSEEDYEGMVKLSQYVIRREFFDGGFEPPKQKVLATKTYQHWTIDRGGASCQPGDYWHVRVPDAAPGEEEWKGHSVSGFSVTREYTKLEKPVNGVKKIPPVLHTFMSLTYEAGLEWGLPDAGSWEYGNVVRAMKMFKGYYFN